MPAVLLECGVIVNRSEEASLQTPEIQHRIVDAAAEAIIQFLHTRQISAETNALRRDAIAAAGAADDLSERDYRKIPL